MQKYISIWVVLSLLALFRFELPNVHSVVTMGTPRKVPLIFEKPHIHRERRSPAMVGEAGKLDVKGLRSPHARGIQYLCCSAVAS